MGDRVLPVEATNRFKIYDTSSMNKNFDFLKDRVAMMVNRARSWGVK